MKIDYKRIIFAAFALSLIVAPIAGCGGSKEPTVVTDGLTDEQIADYQRKMDLADKEAEEEGEEGDE